VTAAGAGGAAAPVLAARGITKRFPGVLANDGIDLALHAGEVHCLLGENGAGKSTLVNILSGMHRPDAGTLELDGAPVTLASPQDALRRGIGTVYQHFTVVPTLTIAENVALGAPGGFWLDLRGAAAGLARTLRDFEIPAGPDTLVRYLSLGQQQRVEIVKALSRGSRVLLLDEPTSILTPSEVEDLFRILGRLRAQGVAIVFITHKLDQALAVSDRVTVLRQGRKVGALDPADLAGDRAAASRRIVDLMFAGVQPVEVRGAAGGGPAPTVLALRALTVRGDRGAPAVREVTLDLARGEILGVAGVDGNGQKELAEAIAGQRRAAGGRVLLDGADVTGLGARQRMARGIGYVTDDRMGEGIVRRGSVAETLLLRAVDRPEFGRGPRLRWDAVEAYAARLIQDFDVRPRGAAARVGTLSGGNVQKLLLARELAWTPRVLVCNQPTHGLDVRTARFVLDTLRARAREGTAVILISSDLDEILEMSDRVSVMFGGRVLRTLPRAESDREAIGRLMLGLAA
jgi:simple sugar transport system ATP-binding protein